MSQSTKSTAQAATAAIQPIASYADCMDTKDASVDAKVYPPTCTTPAGVIYRPTDPNNFKSGQQQINIPNNTYVTADPNIAAQDGYCFSSAVPGPQATATLGKTAGDYALVRVSPNCGDSLELTYSKANGNWLVINISHLGLCFHPEENAVIAASASLKNAVSELCN